MRRRSTFLASAARRIARALRRAALGLQVLALVATGLPAPHAHAALQANPAWWGASASAASGWHYRVPISVSGAAAGSTVVTNVDFAALLSTLGVSGTLDATSPRVVDAGGTLVPTQEFTDSIYAGATDAVGNGRGEVRFIATSTAGTYYLYFDVTANGTKGAISAGTLIGGNFENATAGTQQPPGWTVVRAASAIDSQVRPSENPSIGTDGTLVGNGKPQPRTVDGTPYTGNFSYLLGARSANETATAQNVVVMSRTIAVPASNPGNLTFRYRVQGWDSNDDGNTGSYDYLRGAIVDGGTTTTVLGPQAANYTTAPYSPNKGTSQASTRNSGYGQFNGFDTDTNGTHRAGMTVARGSQPWWTVSVSLAPYAGHTITLQFSTNHTVLYRSWWHIDDVEWSVVAGSVGTPQAFGAALQAPSGAANTTYFPNQTLLVTARLDAVGAAGSVLADLYKPDGTVAVSGIVLYNDGTHGDTTAGDAIWSNNGAVSANPTYTFTTASPLGTWTVLLRAMDGTGAPVKIPGQPATPINGTNYFNVDTQTLTLKPLATITGRVYLDANRNGVYDSGEAAFRSIQVKLVQSGAVINQATPDANGNYSFGGLAAGTYTIVPSTNSSTSDATPSLPAGYVQSQPKTATFTTDVSNGMTVDDDIGLYSADLVVAGRVFADNGAGGATALDGVQGGSEAPLQGVVVYAQSAQGSVIAQTTSGGDGSFALGIPSSAAGTVVTVGTAALAGYNLARVFTGTTGGTANQSAGTISFTPAANSQYSGVVFSQLPASTLSANQMKTAPAGTTVFYSHRFNAGATGSVSFALASTPPVGLTGWAGVLYRDADCSGALKGTESPLAGSVAVNAGDSVCLVIQDAIPAAAALNQQIQHQLSATLTIASPLYTQPTQVDVDVTTVSQGSGLTLIKAVRNLTTASAMDISSQAVPGQMLQYQLTFRNDAATPVSSVQVFDAVPAYGIFASAACGSMPSGVSCSVTKSPPTGATSGAIQWTLSGSVPSGASGTVSFNWSLSN